MFDVFGVKLVWYKQLLFHVLPFTIFSLVFPIVCLLTLAFFAGLADSLVGYKVPLSGEPQGITPGALFVAVS